jgi:hypothetical protein
LSRLARYAGTAFNLESCHEAVNATSGFATPRLTQLDVPTHGAKIGTYDIEQSGMGQCVVAMLHRRLLSRIETKEPLIGCNRLGSWAHGRHKAGAAIAIVMPLALLRPAAAGGG